MSEWISVKDRLPGDYAVLVSGGVAYYADGVWYTVTGFTYPGVPIRWEVTHWMPLPEPPK